MSTASRPRAADSERRQLYLDVATRLFAVHGFVGTTTDMIVAEAGGSKATLYKHFPSKEALIAGLMDQVANWIPPRSDDFRGDDRPLEQALTELGLAALRAVTGPVGIELFRLSLGEYGRFPQLAAVVWEHGPAVTYARFHQFLQERERRGELVVDDRQLAAEQFIAGIVGHLQPRVAMGIADPPDSAEAERRVASAVRTFLARYATGAAREPAQPGA